MKVYEVKGKNPRFIFVMIFNNIANVSANRQCIAGIFRHTALAGGSRRHCERLDAVTAYVLFYRDLVDTQRSY